MSVNINTTKQPIKIAFRNWNGGATASEVSLWLPKLSPEESITVDWGDGTTSQVFGGPGNRMVHPYTVIGHGSYIVKVSADAKVLDFSDPSGDRARGQITSWGDFDISTVFMPDMKRIDRPKPIN